MHRIISAFIVLLLLFAGPVKVLGQATVSYNIEWHDIYRVKNGDGSGNQYFSFEKMAVDPSFSLPVFLEKINCDGFCQPSAVSVTSAEYSDMTETETEIVRSSGILLPDTLTYRVEVSGRTGEEYLMFSLLPFRYDKLSGRYEKVLKFNISIDKKAARYGAGDDIRQKYAGHSVLATGNWIKMAFTKSGICKLTYNDIRSMGLDVETVDPRSIRIFGNGGGMLPEKVAAGRYDDLVENAIMVQGESDGKFDAEDYILFYVSPQLQWKYNYTLKVWEHITNIYSDTAFVFLTSGPGTGKRVQELNSTMQEANVVVNTFDDYALHEAELINLIGSGRRWFGEIFDLTTQYQFDFGFPGTVPDSETSVRIVAAARSTASSSFSIDAAGTSWSVSAAPISTYYNSAYASGINSFQKFPATGDNLSVKLIYNKPLTSSRGWLDYIEVNAKRALKFSQGQMKFRKSETEGSGNIAQYYLGNATTSVVIWDITNPLLARKINTTLDGNTIGYRLPADTLREFIAFDGTSFISPASSRTVMNQDLHALPSPDLLIIAPPVFMEEAIRLAEMHDAINDFSTVIVTPEAIYNEFSSGAPDVSAIRDFMRMFYNKSNGNGKLPYLLLMGDASYDYKNLLQVNTNYIPTFQSLESFDPVHSYTYDDYFGFLDDNEGTGSFDMVDIGIGRLPVKTVEEAKALVDKILHYAYNSSSVQGDWRNVISFVADDEDDNEHMRQADQLADYINTGFNNFNVDKIYLDSYQQSAAPSGNRYPEVNKAITQRIEKGSLIMNYTGHGGETGWAHEEVLRISDINSWDNLDKMPVFVTATCEFSRYDDPERTSAGELVLLNPIGGGIALFTTSRPTFGTPNLTINKSFYKYALPAPGTERPFMGDIIRDAKRESGSDENGRKFVLLGDPALRISTPQLKVITTHINNKPAGPEADTLSALSMINISGIIADGGDHKVTDFNGTLSASVFDKATEVISLANDGGTPFTFSLQKNLLYKGRVAVTNGEFNFSFIVPRDISYRLGFGKISYYAQSDKHDASGSYENIVVGGDGDNMLTDNAGPEIGLYMNDIYFVNGGTTDENPSLLALVSDQSGVNTVGTGIGHDLLAVLDDNYEAPFVLNDYYESDVNTFKSGRVLFPFVGLPAGNHKLLVRAWDVFNNSSEATLDFVVVSSEKFVMENAISFPNPFSEYTDITFSHNQQGKVLSTTVMIYSVTGKPVVTLRREGQDFGSRSLPLRWDGRSATGETVANGFYIYKIISATSNGLSATMTGKLIFTR